MQRKSCIPLVNIDVTDKYYSKRQKSLDFGRLLAPTASRKAALFLVRSRVHAPQGYSKGHF